MSKKHFKTFILVAGMATLALGLSACSSKKDDTTSTNNQEATVTQQSATIKTAKGSFTFTLDAEAAPNTVKNFVAKATAGDYNGRTFHRVEDWVVQGGDPLGTGTGGGNQATELSKRNFVAGSVGVARGGDIKVSNSDQFFICTIDCQFLNSQYTYFGLVTNGLDVVKKIQIGDKIDSITIQ